MARTISFSVKSPTLAGWGVLTLEAVTLGPSQENTSALVNGPFGRPPLPNQVLGSAAAAQNAPLEDRGSKVMAKPWADYFHYQGKRVDELSSLAVGDVNGGPLVQITAWGVDETDTDYWGSCDFGAADTSINPAVNGTSRYGQSIATVTGSGGDFNSQPAIVFRPKTGKSQGAGQEAQAVMNGRAVDHVTVTKFGASWLDLPDVTAEGGGSILTLTPTLYPAAPGQYFLIDDSANYEIIQVTGINYSSGVWTILRGQLGTTAGAHTGRKFYLLKPYQFLRRIGPEVPPNPWPLPLAHAAIPVVEAGLAIGTGERQRIDCVAQFPSTIPCPGIRTCSGAAYLSLGISGSLTAGQNADVRVDAGVDWETIRIATASVLTVPSGTPAKIYLCWIAPDYSTVGLIDSLIIPVGAYRNFDTTSLPQLRMMPYFADTIPSPAWPPNQLRVCTGALDGSKKLLSTMTVTSDRVLFKPDGFLDLVVINAASAANLSVRLSV